MMVDKFSYEDYCGTTKLYGENFMGKFSFSNLVRLWLVAALLIFPFNIKIAHEIYSWNSMISIFIGYIDEITVVVLFPLAIIKFYKNREIAEGKYLLMMGSLLIFVIVGIVSGMINENDILITLIGIFDYIKNFLVVFIYAAFFRKFSELKMIARLVVIIALGIGVVVLMQEVWALISVYVFKKDITESIVYLFRSIPVNLADSWRLGIYKTGSIMHGPNYLGLYCLLILTIYTFMIKKINLAVFIPLCAGIIASVSRVAYLGFIFILAVQIAKGRRKLLVIGVPVLIVILFMTTLWDFNIWNSMGLKGSSINFSIMDGVSEDNLDKKTISYREYTKNKAMEIWKDHPMWGTGPGKFGGVVSVKYNSHLYEAYNVQAIIYLRQMKSLDQFWPQMLAENGFVGTMTFGGFLFLVPIVLVLSRNKTPYGELRGLIAGLIMYFIVILIYMLGAGLNIGVILFSYSAFVGMSLSCAHNSNEKTESI